MQNTTSPMIFPAGAVLLILLGICFYWDARFKRVPNWATLPGIALGLGLNVVFHGWTGLKSSGIGFLVGFGMLLILFLFHWMGGGDVKLMGAVGAIKGYPFVVSALFYSFLVGAFIGMVMLIWNRKLLRTLKNTFLFLVSRALPFLPKRDLKPEETSKIPFGIAIAIGTLWALVMSYLWSPIGVLSP